MKGIQNFLQIVNDNWTTIIVIIGLLIGLYRKITSYIKLSQDQKIDLAKNQMRETILSIVSNVETNWDEYRKAGSIKRAEVISEIYIKYPVLKQVCDQKTLLEEVDKLIDESLVNIKDVIQNK